MCIMYMYYILPYRLRPGSKYVPSDYSKYIDEEYLRRICDESGLKRLVYHGELEVTCRNCNKEIILHCVNYDKSDEGIQTKFEYSP